MKLATTFALIGSFAHMAFGVEQSAKDQAKKNRDLAGYHWHDKSSDRCDLTGMYDVIEAPVHAKTKGFITSEGLARVSFVCYTPEEWYSDTAASWGGPIQYSFHHDNECEDLGGIHRKLMAKTSDMDEFFICTIEAIGFPAINLPKKELPPGFIDGTGVMSYGLAIAGSAYDYFGGQCFFFQVCNALDSVVYPDFFDIFLAGIEVREDVLQFAASVGIFEDIDNFFQGDVLLKPYSAFKSSVNGLGHRY